MKNNIGIIGGGPAGMIAAIFAARNGNFVTIFEKNISLGKKLLLTGNGRCNITNINLSIKNYHGENPKFAMSVISQFNQYETINFFESLGLVLKEEEFGRMFPRSDQAQSVLDILNLELKNLKVNILLNQKIKEIHTDKSKSISKEDSYVKRNSNYNKVHVITYQKKVYKFDKIIIATGGKSYPQTGSTGDGYRLAKNLGHKIVKPFPSSVPLRIKSIVCNKLQGVKIYAKLSIYIDNNKVSEVTDELLFTHLGLSAPAALRSSRYVSKYIYCYNSKNVSCIINFFPEYSNVQLIDLLNKRIKSHPERILANQFLGMLPKKVAPTILKYSNIDPNEKSHSVSKKTIHEVIRLFTNFYLKIDNVLGWENAQFTAGGIDTREIDSKTMQSKIAKNVYFCGEVVDIDGDSGGYNLQWAWSSGCVAGKSC